MDISQIKKDKEKIDEFMDWKNDYEKYREKLDQTKESRDEFFEEMLEERGIKKIQELSEELKNERMNVKNVKDDCVEDLRKATGIMFTDRQRVTIKERVTVREDNIWDYGRSKKASFDKINGRDGRTALHIAREIRDNEARSRFMKGIELIKNIPSVKRKYSVEVENKIDDYNCITVTTTNRVEFKEDIESRYDDKFNVQSLSNLKKGERHLKEARLGYLLVHQDDFIEAQKKLLNKIREQKQKRQETKEKISELFKKELTIHEF